MSLALLLGFHVVWNPNDSAGASVAFTNNNLTATATGGFNNTVLANVNETTGKWYWEVTVVDVVAEVDIGYHNHTQAARTAHFLGDNQHSFGYHSNGNVFSAGVQRAALTTYTDGDRIDVAYDAGSELVWFRKNGGNWNNSATADPATGTEGIDVSSYQQDHAYPAVVVRQNGDSVTANFGPGFAGAVPTGFAIYEYIEGAAASTMVIDSSVAEGNLSGGGQAGNTQDDFTSDGDGITIIVGAAACSMGEHDSGGYGALKQGISFRSTLAFVTDGPNDSFEGPNVNAADWTLTYPRVTAQGVTVGWESRSPTGGWATRNRSNTVDPRLAGIHMVNQVGNFADFRIDLNGPGKYEIRVAAGDATLNSNTHIELFDDAASLGVLCSGIAGGAGRFRDAVNVVRTSADDWVANNQPIVKEFTTTICRFRFGSPTVNVSIAYIFVASHIEVNQGQASGALGDFASAAAGAPVITATAIDTLTVFASAAAGSHIHRGSAANVLEAFAPAAAGAPIVAGTAVTETGAFLSIGVGTVIVAGVASDQLQPFLSSAQGEIGSNDGHSILVDFVSSARGSIIPTYPSFVDPDNRGQTVPSQYGQSGVTIGRSYDVPETKTGTRQVKRTEDGD